MPKKPKNKIKITLSGITITVLLTLLICFQIPAFFPWNLVPKPQYVKGFEDLAQYQHPAIPKVNVANPPYLSAPSFILIDNDTNTVLTSKNPTGRIFPASTTKLITAITALNIYPLDEVVSVGSTYSEGKIMELKTGEQISIKNLVAGLLVYSANDAASVLAEHHQQGSVGFIREMNQLVKKFGLNNTNFVNFDGIHSSQHFSTVSDLAQIGRLAIKSPIILSIVKEKELLVTDTSGQIIHKLVTTNELLANTPEIEGLKTGWTPEAGGSFVSLINLNGHYLIGVVAQSTDRFQDTKKLLEWAKVNVTWQSYQP